MASCLASRRASGGTLPPGLGAVNVAPMTENACHIHRMDASIAAGCARHPRCLSAPGRPALSAWIVRRVRERVKSDISGRAVAERRIPGRHALGAVLGTLFLLVGLSVGGCGSVSGGLHADTEALLAATVVSPDAPRPAT